MNIDRLQLVVNGEIGISDFERLCLPCHEVVGLAGGGVEEIACLLDSPMAIPETDAALGCVVRQYGMRIFPVSWAHLRVESSNVYLIPAVKLRQWMEKKWTFGLVDFRQCERRESRAFFLASEPIEFNLNGSAQGSPRAGMALQEALSGVP